MINRIEDYNIEFKDIEGYEGLYAVTIDGRVWSYKSKRFLKPQDMGKGYLMVNLCKDGQRKNCRVHRLVAKAFIPNPENKPDINHLDENKGNNHVSNLAWATRRENLNYGTRSERAAQTLSKLKSKPVYCLETGEVYKSQNDAAEALGVSHQGISRVVLGQQEAIKGYHLVSVSLGDKKLNHIVDSFDDKLILDKDSIMNIKFKQVEKMVAAAM